MRYFYKYGYIALKRDVSFLKEAVSSTIFQKETGRYGSDLTQRFEMNNLDQPLTGFIEEPKVHHFFKDLVKAYGTFTSSHIMVHKYEKFQGLNWHHDVFDRSIILALAYTGDDVFSEDDGGVLEIGRCRVDTKGVPVSDPEVLSRHIPNVGTLVLLNNTDPTLLHRVTPMKSEKIRIVVSCQLGFSDMVVIK